MGKVLTKDIWRKETPPATNILKITCKEDCGNAPKKILLRDFNMAAAKGDFTFIEKNISDDIVWHLYEPAGQQQIAGKENVLKEYKDNLVIAPAEFVIDTILTHGNAGAVNGTIKAKGGKSFVFCDIYKFSSHAMSAKIKEMTSYIIEKS